MDGLNHLRIDEVYDADSNGELEDPAATGDAWRVQRVYVNGPGQLGQIAKVIVFTYASPTTNTVASEDVYYYHYDILGNVSVISDPSGAEADQFEQDAFGNLVSGGWSTRIGGITEQITTKPYDADLGLYYFNARWYDPQVGAFVSRDAVRTHGRSRYAFCRSRPTSYVDPSGHREWVNVGYEIYMDHGCICDMADEAMSANPDMNWQRLAGRFGISGVSTQAFVRQLVIEKLKARLTDAWNAWTGTFTGFDEIVEMMQTITKMYVVCSDPPDGEGDSKAEQGELCASLPNFHPDSPIRLPGLWNRASLYYKRYDYSDGPRSGGVFENVAKTFLHEKAHLCGWRQQSIHGGYSEHELVDPWKKMWIASGDCNNHVPYDSTLKQ